MKNTTVNQFNLKLLTKNVILNVIANLIASAIIAIVTYIEINLCTGIVCFFVVFTILSFVYHYRKKNHKNQKVEDCDDNGDKFKYKYLKKEVYFEYSISHEHIYNNYHSVCALEDNVNSFHGRYTWDASKVKMTCKKPQNTQIITHPKKDMYQNYSIIFNERKYNTGDEYRVEIESKMSGNLKFPLFASTVIVPTDILIIKIKLPTSYLKNNCLRLIKASNPSEKEPSITKDAKLNQKGEYTWKIPNPQLWHEYSIEWNFKEDVLKSECPESII